MKLTLGKFLLTCCLFLPFIFTVTADVILGIKFDVNVEGYLKRAADANTIEVAEQQLYIVLSNIEVRNLTKGSTGVLWDSPQTDIGFWYQNLKQSREELMNLPSNSSSLEKSNMLIKLRETILDHHGTNGDQVTSPYNIDCYPYNTLFVFAYVFSIILGIVAVVYIMYMASDQI